MNDMLKNKIVYLENELESIHLFLDDCKIPREIDGDYFSVVGRIKILQNGYLKAMSDLETGFQSTQN